ncbi:MAG: ATP-binding protein [Dehalococcoidia bacterium]
MSHVRDDPLREVRAYRGLISFSLFLVLLALLALIVLQAFLLRLTPFYALFMFAIGLTLATAFFEYASRYVYRASKRIALPSLIGVQLATIHDQREAASAATDLVVRWLQAKAAVTAWLDDAGQELMPVAAQGMPQGWLEAPPTLAIGHRSLIDAVNRDQVIAKPTVEADPWFGDFGSGDSVVYVPLVSRQRAIGVMALVGSGRELRDRKLLSGLGVVLALVLDNCRLYQAEHERALEMQAVAHMKSDFLMTVSHELRTPLTSIRTAAEMLLEEEEREDRDSPRSRLVRNIVKGSSRLTSLVADLLDVSQQKDPAPLLERERVAAAEVVSNAVAQVYSLIQAKAQVLDVQVPSPGPDIVVDRRRFEQIIINILSNAHRHTPSEGRITIKVDGREGEVFISISDNGPGIPEKDRGSIFEPFYRGERGGLGLGLAIARALAEMHGGRLWVEKSDASGTTFRLAVPRVEDQKSAAQPVARAGGGRAH